MTVGIVMTCFLVLGDFSSENFNNSRFILLPIVVITGMVAYIGKDAIGGKSIGKRVLGLMVRDSFDHNQIPSMSRLFQRNLSLAFWPFQFFELSDLPEKQRRGDRIANTVVLQNPIRPKTVNYVIIGIGLFVSIIIGIFLLVSSMFLKSEPYRISIEQIENSEEIRSEIGTITGYGFMPTGSINITNGVGEANLCINVKGSIKNKTICTELSKSKNGKWVLDKME